MADEVKMNIPYDDDHWLIKEELTHYGVRKVILREKRSGEIIERIIS